LCHQAECDYLAGRSDAAIAIWQEASSMAAQLGAGAESELALALARLHAVLGPPAAGSG
jgi:hypothetical protein